MNLSTGHWRQPNTWLDMSMCIACYCQWWVSCSECRSPSFYLFSEPPRLSKWDFLLCMMKVTSPSLRSEVGIHISHMEVLHLVQGWCQLVAVPSYIKFNLPVSIELLLGNNLWTSQVHACKQLCCKFFQRKLLKGSHEATSSQGSYEVSLKDCHSKILLRIMCYCKSSVEPTWMPSPLHLNSMSPPF